uniref:Copia protein n=1 Tax=Cajanus cajan TaxID=3821 RepID=A0A151SMI4_CAJCA|nr:Copia protein [Cajanus cajan]
MTTRSKNGIIKPRINSTLLLSSTEPKTVKVALIDPNWFVAMKAEIKALHDNNTWRLVELPSGRKPIGCRWVFRIKENFDGSINKYKARLVVKGFDQQPDLHFSKTFSPVVKPVIIRIVFSLAVSLVCKLQKALYGLKHAPCAWFERLTSVLLMLGFNKSKCDPSLFIFSDSTTIVYMLVYMDDIILTRNSSPIIGYISVNKVSQFMCSPMEEHWKVVKRILRYLKGTIGHGLMFTPANSTTFFNLTTFTDVDKAIDPNDRRSTLAACIYLGPNMVSWWSKKQLLVATSSTEVEYRALAQAVTEVLWIQSFLKELQIKFNTPIVLCDNHSTISLSHNPVLHSRSKHMELYIFFVREKVLSKALVVSHIPAQNQDADVLTKALSPRRFLFLQSKLNVVDSSTIYVSSALSL